MIKKRNATRSERNRKIFFDKCVHYEKIKKCISGKNEIEVTRVLKILGYNIEEDYVRQHPIGCRYVLDFAFIHEQVAIEIDGKDHAETRMKIEDEIRDKFLYSIGWTCVRILEKDFFGDKHYYYQCLIKEIVEYRRKEYEEARLKNLDLIEFNQSDYESMAETIRIRKKIQ